MTCSRTTYSSRPCEAWARSNAHRAGMALFGVMAILATLSLIGGIVFTAVTTNILIGGHYFRQHDSLHQATAGIHYSLHRLNTDLLAGTLSLGAPTITVNYSAPSGYRFDPITELIQLTDPNVYLIRATGRSGTSQSTIEAVVGRGNLLGNLGLFGDQNLTCQPGHNVYSYDFKPTSNNPSPADSNGDAAIGSNESVRLAPNSSLDGVVYLGKSSLGVPATYSGSSTQPWTEIDRLEPDPLGIVGGPLATSFAQYSNSANNSNLVAGISGNQLIIASHESFTLESGYYYLTDFELGANGVLNIESTPAEPVVIFLDGPFRSQPGCDLVSTSHSPQALYIFSRSNEEIRIQPDHEFRGVIYAPYADIQLQPIGDAYGVFWGRTATLQPGGNLYLDTDAVDDFQSRNLVLLSWKELR